MNSNERLLEKMLDAHQKWIMAEEGRRARKFCAKDFIRNCEGDVKLKDFDFKGKSLQHAIFDSCNVSHVDFTRAKLNDAIFCHSNAMFANFNDADCTNVDFSDCDLDWAKFNNATKLYWANFHLAQGPFVLGYFGKHHAIAYADIAVIGCEAHLIDYWLEHKQKIGDMHRYSKAEIEIHCDWLQLAKKTLAEINRTQE